ncbi:MAG: hypothetical protein JRG92_06330 [Deltaproteobacteria bacterium]|nr:hypothetical protein [Deltaproteobacteria bacterium]MBW2383230.1 hypothetical protein [Deltaproteobacteria bacterium]MBW2696372.1 hypothetical protein [Deltaproteobacteria bacterium]
MGSRVEEEKEERDVDSAGVYYMSVEDFEWRPPQRGKGRAADRRAGQQSVQHKAPRNGDDSR